VSFRIRGSIIKKVNKNEGGALDSILMVFTNLCTDTGCTDNREEGVGLWPHSHVNTREPLGEFLLILLCWANCVHINLHNIRQMEERRPRQNRQEKKSRGKRGVRSLQAKGFQ